MDGLATSKKNVIDYGIKHPDYRIVHDNLKDMNQVTSSQTYQKGSWILHMLRGVIGTDAFWKGIKSYYLKYQNLNASTTDFRREMEEASGQDLKYFFEQWLYKPGALKLNGTWQYDAKKKEVKIMLDQIQADGSMFKTPIQVAIYGPKRKKPLIKIVQVNEKASLLIVQVDAEPAQVVLDPDSWLLMESTFTRKQ